MCEGCGDVMKSVFFLRNFDNKDGNRPSLLRVCPVVKQTGLGSLCLSEWGGVQRMWLGALKRVIFS